MSSSSGLRTIPLVFNLTSGRVAKDFKGFYNAIERAPGPLLGLDVGTKHIGMALSDDGRTVAFSKLGFRRAAVHQDRARIQRQLQSAGAVGVVVGMPLPRGNESCATLQRFVELYAMSVLEGIKMPCAFWDESYTTQLALAKFKDSAKRSTQRDARRKKKCIDAGAAAEILQEAMDALALYSLDNAKTGDMHEYRR